MFGTYVTGIAVINLVKFKNCLNKFLNKIDKVNKDKHNNSEILAKKFLMSC
jgi:hypothetical protein